MQSMKMVVKSAPNGMDPAMSQDDVPVLTSITRWWHPEIVLLPPTFVWLDWYTIGDIAGALPLGADLITITSL